MPLLRARGSDLGSYPLQEWNPNIEKSDRKGEIKKITNEAKRKKDFEKEDFEIVLE